MWVSLNLRRRICQNLSWYTLMLFPSSQWSCIYLHQPTIWTCVLGIEFDFQGSGIQSVSVLLLISYWRNSNILCSSFKVPSQFSHLLPSFPLSFQQLLFWYVRLVSPPSSSDRRLVPRGAPHKITMQIGTQHEHPIRHDGESSSRDSVATWQSALHHLTVLFLTLGSFRSWWILLNVICSWGSSCICERITVPLHCVS